MLLRCWYIGNQLWWFKAGNHLGNHLGNTSLGHVVLSSYRCISVRISVGLCNHYFCLLWLHAFSMMHLIHAVTFTVKSLNNIGAAISFCPCTIVEHVVFNHHHLLLALCTRSTKVLISQYFIGDFTVNPYCSAWMYSVLRTYHVEVLLCSVFLIHLEPSKSTSHTT